MGSGIKISNPPSFFSFFGETLSLFQTGLGTEHFSTLNPISRNLSPCVKFDFTAYYLPVSGLVEEVVVDLRSWELDRISNKLFLFFFFFRGAFIRFIGEYYYECLFKVAGAML